MSGQAKRWLVFPAAGLFATLVIGCGESSSGPPAGDPQVGENQRAARAANYSKVGLNNKPKAAPAGKPSAPPSDAR